MMLSFNTEPLQARRNCAGVRSAQSSTAQLVSELRSCGALFLKSTAVFVLSPQIMNICQLLYTHMLSIIFNLIF